MIRTLKAKRKLVALLLGTMAAASPGQVRAEEDMFDGKWHFAVTPYVFVPKVYGTVTYQLGGTAGSATATVDPNAYLQSLDFFAMVAGEARKGEGFIFTDYMYFHLSGDNSVITSVTGPGGRVEVPINQGGSFDVVANVWTLAGGFTVWHKPAGFLDLFGGMRLLSLNSSAGWSFSTQTGSLAREGSISQTENIWAGIVGLKGQVRLGESNWFLPYYGDIGGSSDNWTWQAALGGGYHFGWGDIVLVGRSLSYNFSGQLHQFDLRMTGPMLSATFTF